MSRRLGYLCLLIVAGCLLLPRPLTAADDGAAGNLVGNLVTAKWLEQNLKNPDLLILDASPAQTYASRHIAGAITVDLMSYGVQETPAEMQKLFQSLGISPAKRIVVYDQGAGMTATRLFFSLCYYGYPAENLAILDGGLLKWQEDGLPVTNQATPAPKKGSFEITAMNQDVKAELPEVLTASGDPANNALVEALDANWHFGQIAVFERAGHLPYGVMMPSNDFYNPDGTFKSAEEMKRMLAYFSIRPEQRIYAYCGGGVAASVPFFALKFILKYPHVKLYTGSEMDWLADERGLPYWTYDAPFLMRATRWMQFWTGQMIRMFVSPTVSIVDVRPREAFGQGHVPFALNIPAEVIKANIGSPEKLAGILGAAGVDVSHEAVVISGAGLTKESALAFVTLQKLGQKKVSVFMESMDRWTQLGFSLTKDATAVGPKKSRRDVSIPPTVYPADAQGDVIIAEPTSAPGLYPRLFIASGASVPAKVPDGTVIHVAYTDLLNADGTPKAAKDIWNLLAKAGVPRYADLVCFSDDPAEAAANYFILKLMGYPDVKVLMN